MDFDLIDKRREIRILIQEGKIVEAVEMINDINPEILDNNDELYFSLKKQKLIELILNNKTEEALQFAQGVIAEKAMKRPEFLEQMEEVMTLLAFDKPKESPLKHLVDISARQKLASDVNEAILTSQ
jgi:glucose-induced degradation protein 8